MPARSELEIIGRSSWPSTLTVPLEVGTRASDEGTYYLSEVLDGLSAGWKARSPRPTLPRPIGLGRRPGLAPPAQAGRAGRPEGHGELSTSSVGAPGRNLL